MQKKHDKQTNEGKALRTLREIRISARPSWDHDNPKLIFYFIYEEEQDNFDYENLCDRVNEWLDLLGESERFSFDHEVISLEKMKAKEYIESDQLDFDHLSM